MADETSPPPDVDDLVAQLRARVEERRRAGAYPPGLEEELGAHFHRIVRHRGEERPEPPAVAPVLDRVRGALPLEAARISSASSVPAGQVVHKSVAKLVGRQVQGVLEQVQGFADPAAQALDALNQHVADLHRQQAETAVHLDALYEQLAESERRQAELSLRLDGLVDRLGAAGPGRAGI